MSEKKEFREILRIANVDVNGHRPIYNELTKIRGVGTGFANMVCKLIGLEKGKKSGELTDEEIQRIEKVLNNPSEFGAPEWMYNRRKDPETGEQKHLITNDLRFTQENDVKLLRKIKSYRGLRHASGLPVRGQKTKSNFRKTKSKISAVRRKGK